MNSDEKYLQQIRVVIALLKYYFTQTCSEHVNQNHHHHHQKKRGGGGGCFPLTAKVNLQNGKTVAMTALQVGDHVQTGKIFASLFLVSKLKFPVLIETPYFFLNFLESK